MRLGIFGAAPLPTRPPTTPPADKFSKHRGVVGSADEVHAGADGCDDEAEGEVGADDLRGGKGGEAEQRYGAEGSGAGGGEADLRADGEGDGGEPAERVAFADFMPEGRKWR